VLPVRLRWACSFGCVRVADEPRASGLHCHAGAAPARLNSRCHRYVCPHRGPPASQHVHLGEEEWAAVEEVLTETLSGLDAAPPLRATAICLRLLDVATEMQVSVEGGAGARHLMCPALLVSGLS
jgi:hypothetical protein